jgi:hypothetical protein
LPFFRSDRRIDATRGIARIKLIKMAQIQPIALNYSELFNEPANNPFGQDLKRQEKCIAALYLNWRTNANAALYRVGN